MVLRLCSAWTYANLNPGRCRATCQRILTKGHIAILSPLAAANGFVRPWRWLPFNACFLGPTRATAPHGISIGSAVFAGLRNVTNRQTDKQSNRPRYSVCSNRPLLLDAMRPHNMRLIRRPLMHGLSMRSPQNEHAQFVYPSVARGCSLDVCRSDESTRIIEVSRARNVPLTCTNFKATVRWFAEICLQNNY